MARMRRTVGIVAVLALSLEARASYLYTELQQLASQSDVIVIGSVSEVLKDLFRFQVERTLRGSPDGSGELAVIRFRDWPCARRWAPYAVGQRLVLFLKRDVSGVRTYWQIVGAGGEGEILVEGERAYYHLAEGRADQCFDVTGGRFCGVSVPLDQFNSAMADYGGLFEWSFGWQEPYVIRQLGSDAEVLAFRARSPFHDQLVTQTLEAIRTLAERKQPGKRRRRITSG